jgi:hypothetical protein
LPTPFLIGPVPSPTFGAVHPVYVFPAQQRFFCFPDGQTLLQVLTGSTNDISPLLFFRWYEPVHDKVDDSDFPVDSHEKCGRWVGIAEHVGHAMTFKILTDNTCKIIYRWNICSALDPDSWNLRMEPLNDGKVLALII